MSAVAIEVCLLSVLSLCAVAVLSVAPCDQTIIDKLKTKSSCYEGGVPLKQGVSGVFDSDLRVTAKGDLPRKTGCEVSYYKNDGNSYATLYKWSSGPNGAEDAVSHNYTIKEDHILETDSTGAKYKLYIIHNTNNVAYSYYGCIESGANGDGLPMLEVADNGLLLNGINAKTAVEKAKSCFEELGITKSIAIKRNACTFVQYIQL